MPWRLLVVDGADKNRMFPLPENGTAIIGNSHKYSDICLNDLYVARVHCQIETEGDRICITAMADDKETLVNGQRVTQHLLAPGEVLRVGNSLLKLQKDDELVTEDYEVVEDDEVAEDAEIIDDAEVVDAEPVADSAKATDPPQLTWENLHQLTGHTLGHFSVGALLGRGHHGCVFRARDINEGREIALKVLSPDFPANPAELQRFAQTIQQIASIYEEHLVRWFAAGKKKNFIWISMELIEGESLAQILKRNEPPNKLKWRNAFKIAQDVGTALNCLHMRKMVHGNVVPSNILISLTDRTVRLNDLLFQQAMEGSEWQNRRLERKTLVELPYLAPERTKEKLFWDIGADIYSLGAVVYHRLTGRPPFQGKSPTETIELILNGKPDLPRKIVPEVPDAFQAIVMKMLARSQEDRFETPAHLLDALAGVAALP